MRPFWARKTAFLASGTPGRPIWTANSRNWACREPFLTHSSCISWSLPRFRPSLDLRSPKPTTDEHGWTRMGVIRPRTSDFRPRHPLRAIFSPRNAFRGGFQTTRPPRGPFCEIGIEWHPKTGIKPTSRRFSPCPPAPNSPNPQPVAPLTRPRISAILLPIRKNPRAT